MTPNPRSTDRLLPQDSDPEDADQTAVRYDRFTCPADELIVPPRFRTPYHPDYDEEESHLDQGRADRAEEMRSRTKNRSETKGVGE